MVAMLTLTLLRHGQTSWNKDLRVMGEQNIPLDSRGVSQAKEVGLSLQHAQLAAIVSSPQLRCLETAQWVAMHHPHLAVVMDERLREMRFDRWEGKVFDEIKDDPVYKARRAEVETFSHPEVESVQEVRARVASMLHAYANQKGHFVWVSHGDVLRALVSELEARPDQDFFSIEVSNADPLEYVHDGNRWHRKGEYHG
jgi:broad specificity phosphatase PhoE